MATPVAPPPRASGKTTTGRTHVPAHSPVLWMTATESVPSGTSTVLPRPSAVVAALAGVCRSTVRTDWSVAETNDTV